MIDNKGLYGKFRVSRVDGDPTGKHAECGYFVLDPMHDRAALLALEVYADATATTRPMLAADLWGWLEAIRVELGINDEGQESDHA